ncbi:MAG: SRPBCC family protein [Acidimicrobiales bacterium]|jgi:uncharacterized protein YndB with AHSA1/START domain
MINVEVTIEASPGVVWSVLTDVERWPEWTHSVTEVTRLDHGDFSVGSKARIKQPRLPSMVWTVTDLAADRSFEWAAKGFGFHLVAGHQISDVANGRTMAILSVHQRGTFGQLLEALSSRSARRHVQMEAAGLKARAESIG